MTTLEKKRPLLAALDDPALMDKAVSAANALIAKTALKQPDLLVHPSVDKKEAEQILKKIAAANHSPLNNNVLVALIAEMAMKNADRKERQKTQDAKDEHARKKAAQQKTQSPHHAAAEKEELEKEEPDFEEEEENQENEDFDADDLRDALEDPDLDINDYDASADEWLDVVKDMPVGAQTGMVCAIAQALDNKDFHHKGADYLMDLATNGLLPTDQRVLAFAGMQALHRSDFKPFPGFSPQDMSGGKPALSSLSVNRAGTLTEDELAETAFDAAQNPHAALPFANKKTAFKETVGEIAYDARPPVVESAPHYVETQKAKSIFGDLELKPNAAFFDAVYGKRSDT